MPQDDFTACEIAIMMRHKCIVSFANTMTTTVWPCARCNALFTPKADQDAHYMDCLTNSTSIWPMER